MVTKTYVEPEQAESNPILLTTSEVAKLLHVHPNTIRRWHSKGMIRAFRVGPRRDRRFERGVVEQVIRMYMLS